MGEKNIIDFMAEYGDEDKAHAYLVGLRWPQGPRCPRCEAKQVYTYPNGKRFKCYVCAYFFTVRSGTLLHGSAIPLTKWMAAVFMFTQTSKGLSSVQLAKNIGVTQKTAWFMLHRIRHVAKETPDVLTGEVQIDETYVGGKAGNRHATKRGKGDRGRSLENKQPVVGFKNKNTVRAFPTKNTATKTLRDLIDENVANDAHVVTDSYHGYKRLPHKHTVIHHNVGEYVKDGHHTNGIESFWAILKRGIFGIYHNVSRKHMGAYVDEYAYRANTKENRIADVLTRAVKNNPYHYKTLIG